MKKKTIVVLTFLSLLGITTFTSFSTKYSLSPVATNAQQSQTDDLDTLNLLAQQNSENASFEDSKKVAQLICNNLLVLEIPAYTIETYSEQIATAHLNGADAIDENNIVEAINNLARQAEAPKYARTNYEQVKVVRTILNRRMPDLVSPVGYMNDIEAFAVFTAVLSQKVSNDAFMVSPAQFSASMTSPANQPFPGSGEATTGDVAIVPESPQAIEMNNVISNYVNSPGLASFSDITSMIGIN